MDNTSVTPALQDYLEVILLLSEEQEKVRITDIARKLNIAKASTTQAVQVLKDLNMVHQDKYGPVVLTELGREEANSVWYKHQVIYRFLVDMLQVNPAIAEKDAYSMEHLISQETLEKLVVFLNSTRAQQYKYKQNQNGEMGNQCKTDHTETLSVSSIYTLADLLPGKKGTVIQVTGNGTIRRRILEMGIVPGCEIEFEDVAPLGDPIRVSLNGYHLSLRKEEAASILIEKGKLK
ncbi:MAG: DtxR family transcriptional regulator [Bacillota bacterium]|nr:DtxR family transcriptional regulator [Bacillota bacterium]